MDPDPLILEAIEVDGLLGRERTVISLNKRIPTVLTGANGTGKSTILKLVNAVSLGDWASVSRAPLREFTLFFQGGQTFTAKIGKGSSGVSLEWAGQSVELPASQGVESLPSWVGEALVSSQYNVDEVLSTISDTARANGIGYSEFREVRQLLRRWQEAQSDTLVGQPEWSKDLTEAFTVLFVTDQRLVVESRRPSNASSGVEAKSRSLAVDAAANYIADRVRLADSLYARASQLQDRRFPQDVIAAMGEESVMSTEAVEELISQVDKRREMLREVGLLDVDVSYLPEIADNTLEDPRIRPVVATFLQSTLNKLAVLDDLAQRLTVFKSFLDGRFDPKTVLLSRQEGLQFGLPDRSIISPRQLSSGEQQILVLAFEILFRSQENTLVLVDEPEISLHVLWQDTLIEDLTKMGEASKLKFLMASHSPMILAQHPEVERNLD